MEKFSTISAEVYNKSLKPVVDVAMFSAALWRSEGWQGPVGLFSWFSIAARPALLRSWANFQAPSGTRMSHSAC